MERLKRFAPPGMGINGIRAWTIGAIAVSMFFSLFFLLEYFSELSELRRMMEYPVYRGTTVAPFSDLIYAPMAVFRLAPVVPLLYSATYYEYFYRETKSIYIMKRLRSPLEFHIRCLILPVLGALLVVAAGLAVYGLYYLIYMTCTPESLLPANL